MFKFFVIICAVLFLSVNVLAGPPPVEHSRYAVLMDASNGQILWGRNENAHREMASTTKMMTALLLLERGHLNDVVTAPDGINKLPESSLHLSPGETLTLHDLLYAMLLRSANDTAVAGADYLSGSVPAFVALMNQRAKELGCDDTHFVTPNGLYAPGHYSTAADLARIASYALATQPLFDQIVRTPKYKISRSMHIHDVWVRSTFTKFLQTFPGADGVKTGYISAAGHCFVGSATRGGWRLIAVALDSDTCREDVEAILDFGYANFLPVVVVRQGQPVGTLAVPQAAPVPVQSGQEIHVVLPKGRPVPPFQVAVVPLPTPPVAPVVPGEVVGTVTVMLGGRVVATGPAVAAQAVPLEPAASLLRSSRPIGRALAGGLGPALCLLALVAAGGFFYGTAAKNTRRRRSRLAARVRGVDSGGARPGER